MTRYRCTYRNPRTGKLCSINARAGFTTCGRHAEHGHAVEQLRSRRRRSPAGSDKARQAPRAVESTPFLAPDWMTRIAVNPDRTLTAARNYVSVRGSRLA